MKNTLSYTNNNNNKNNTRLTDNNSVVGALEADSTL